MTVVRHRVGTLGGKHAAFDEMNGLAALAESFFEQRTLHAAIDHADRDAFTVGARIAEEALRRQEGKDLVEHVTAVRPRRRRAHGRASAVMASSISRRL